MTVVVTIFLVSGKNSDIEKAVYKSKLQWKGVGYSVVKLGNFVFEIMPETCLGFVTNCSAVYKVLLLGQQNCQKMGKFN